MEERREEDLLGEVRRIRLPRINLPLILEIEEGGKIYEKPVMDNFKDKEPKVRVGNMDEVDVNLKRKIKKYRIGRKR
jgi:hypothetical protein